MTRFVPCLVLLAACAGPKEAQVVQNTVLPTGLVRRLELDTVRLQRGARDDQWTVAGLVERHLATVGLVRPGEKKDDTITLLADLPTPGYALRAIIQPRPEQFCHLEVEVVQQPSGKRVDAAPWWVVHSLDEAMRNVETLAPPRFRAMDDVRFAKLHAEAAQAQARGEDRLMTWDEYLHAPRPLQAMPDDYYIPRPNL